MANKKLEKLAEARGVTVEWYIDSIVVPMVNTHGQQETARKLGVTQASVSNWLKGKYTPRMMWLKSATPEEVAQISALAAKVKRREQERQES